MKNRGNSGVEWKALEELADKQAKEAVVWKEARRKEQRVAELVAEIAQLKAAKVVKQEKEF